MRIFRNILFWVIAMVLTLLMAKYQRTTGPTYPISGSAQLGSEAIEYSLKRSHGGENDHSVVIPVKDQNVSGTLYWKHLVLDEPFYAVEMTLNDSAEVFEKMHGPATITRALEAKLPHQPPAGKLEYHVTLKLGEEIVQLPEEKETAVIRYKGSVPASVLIPHIIAMFLAMFLSTRAAIAVFAGEKTKLIAWITLLVLVVGGLIFGPIVQKHAFGAYWTGWPFGEDLTDNKLAVGVLAWLIAVWRISRKNSQKKDRWWVLGAALVLLGVYMIPHSARGSSFDYESGSVVTGKQEVGKVLNHEEIPDTLLQE